MPCDMNEAPEPAASPGAYQQRDLLRARISELLVRSVRDYAIFMLDLEGRVVTWNEGAERIFGYSESEITGRGCTSFFSEEQRRGGLPERLLEQAKETGHAQVETLFVCQDGSTFDAETAITATYDEQKQLIGYGLVARDVSDRHKADEALRISERMFRSLMEATPEAMVVVDSQAEIVFVNAITLMMFGYQSSEELVGQPLEMLVPAKSVAAHRGLRETYQHDPHARPMGAGLALFARRRDGSEFPVDISLSPARTPKGMVTIAAVRDITERKLMEAEIVSRAHELAQANEHLKTVDRLKTQFISTVSHELRTPLTSIVGFSEFLADEISGELTEEQAGFVKQIQAGSVRLQHLVDDMLDFARLELGTFRLAKQRTDLTQIVQGAADSLIPQAQAAGLTLTVKEPDRPVWVQIDSKRIGQVVLNLIGNAMKFTPRGGHVELQVSMNDQQASVHVRDDGIGVAAEHVPRLFERFFQADASTTRQQGGVGLGLAISRSLVEAHGGSIAVESEQGSGSTFWFSLPR